MQLTKFHRELISRATMGAVAAGLIYGGVKCALVALSFSEQLTPVRGGQSGDGAALPILMAIILLVLGIIFALAAVTPTSLFARITGPPSNTTLHENPEPPGRWWWWV